MISFRHACDYNYFNLLVFLLEIKLLTGDYSFFPLNKDGNDPIWLWLFLLFWSLTTLVSTVGIQQSSSPQMNSVITFRFIQRSREAISVQKIPG